MRAACIYGPVRSGQATQQMESACAGLILVNGSVDVTLLVLAIIDAIRGETALLSITAWRIILTVLLLLQLLWYAFFVADSKYWCLCHYDSYRNYINANIASTLVTAFYAWISVEGRRETLVIYAVLFVPRLVFTFNMADIWGESPRYYRDARAAWRSYIKGD